MAIGSDCHGHWGAVFCGQGRDHALCYLHSEQFWLVMYLASGPGVLSSYNVCIQRPALLSSYQPIFCGPVLNLPMPCYFLQDMTMHWLEHQNAWVC